MCHLFETISIRDGVAENLTWHQQRLDASYRTLFGMAPEFVLAEVISIPPECRQGLFRCRVDYDSEIREISFTPYQAKEITSLQLVEDNTIDYMHKSADRRQLDQLYTLRGSCGDVLIVKNGLITDTTYANVILWDGRQWLTPSEPLLPGTCRARLIHDGLISEAKIKASDLHLFKELKLINAMRGMGDMKAIPVDNISR
jgi:4-amino-4-deoxychorismate lyase